MVVVKSIVMLGNSWSRTESPRCDLDLSDGPIRLDRRLDQ